MAAGALEGADAVKIVRRRGELMFAAGQEVPGTMAAVMGPGRRAGGRDLRRGQRPTAGVVVLANHNSEAQVAISGEVDAGPAAGEALNEAGARRVIPLNVSGAFHSPLLEGAAASSRSFLDGIEVARCRSAPGGQRHGASGHGRGGDLKQGFAASLTSPVLWHDIMDVIAAGKAGPKVVLEVGPGKVLTEPCQGGPIPEIDFLPVGTVDDLTAGRGWNQEIADAAA